MQLAQQGIQYDQYMKATGMDEAKLIEDAKEPALKQVRMDLAMAAIIKEENIDATDEEVEAEFQKMADQYGMDLETVKKYLHADQVKDQLKSQKAIAVVTGQCHRRQAREEARQEVFQEGGGDRRGRGARGGKARQEDHPQEGGKGRGGRRGEEARQEDHQEGGEKRGRGAC